jgi:hypothetical protein
MPEKDIHLIPPPADVNAPKTPEEFETLEEQRKAERVADEAAEQAGETERRYDRDHDLFTK